MGFAGLCGPAVYGPGISAVAMWRIKLASGQAAAIHRLPAPGRRRGGRRARHRSRVFWTLTRDPPELSIKLTASLTVAIFWAASSGISHPNSSSKAITSSTVSRLSAPRSRGIA